MNTGILVESLKSISFYLNSAQKKEGILMFFLLLISSLLDVFGLASLIPVIMAASEPGYVFRNEILNQAFIVLNFNSEKSFLIFLIISIFLFFLLKNLFTTWINYKQVRFTADVIVNIVQDQYNKYVSLPFWEFSNVGSSNILNAILNIPNAFTAGIMRPLFIFFSEVIIVVVIVIGIFLFKPILIFILGLVLAPSTYLTYRAIKNKSHQIGNRINELKPIAYSIGTDSFLGFVEIKLAGKQNDFKRKIIENQRELQDLEARSYLYSLLPLKIIELVAILGVVTIFLYSLLFSDDPKELITIVGLFAAAAYRLMPSVNRLLVALVDIKKNQYTIDTLKLYSQFRRNADITPQKGLSFSREIKLDNVSFTFPKAKRPTLNKINISIAKGERIGFVGTSGSGKTSLMNLLLRFYTEQQGAVFVDGVRLDDTNLEAWHKIIGYVKQDTFLMEASIKDNITLGDLNVDYSRLDYAVEQASLKQFVEDLPHGVDTFIGERGSKLSGGQRQRIGIARALYKKTELIILDEATSALDNETEKEVNEAINKLSETDITILIIAHRITTLRECNKIYELKNGEIISEKSYEELVKEVI
ncbi:ABC transporter ATP-binding protein [Adhaeribacter aquaticus]|uniref:ABC transporter ATP-binding protein n=1 Tax=Adhaeribacter aquaticus TaxID=299567 RepID=UPI00040881E8|nr:ABC transporter ATP-binding protein/permease [Adhaeribacter aquaticus]